MTKEEHNSEEANEEQSSALSCQLEADFSETAAKKKHKPSKHLPETVDLSLIPEACPEYIKRGGALDILDLVDDTWRPGRTIKIDKAKRHVLVHFIGYNKRYDEWLPYNSARLREIQPAESSTVESDVNHWASGLEEAVCDKSGLADDADDAGEASGGDDTVHREVSMGGYQIQPDPLLSCAVAEMPVAVAAPSPSQRPRRGGEGEKAKNSLFTPDSNYRKPKLKHHDGDISSGESTPPDIPSRPQKDMTSIPRAPTWKTMKPVSLPHEAPCRIDNGTPERAREPTALLPANPAQPSPTMPPATTRTPAPAYGDNSQVPADTIPELHAAAVSAERNGHVVPEPLATMDVQAAVAETAADSQQTCTSVDTGDVSRYDESNAGGTAVATSAGQCKKGRERRKSTPPTAPADTTEGRPKRCGLGELARTSLFINHPVLPELDEAGKPVTRPKRSGEGEAAKNELFTNSPVSGAHTPAKSPAGPSPNAGVATATATVKVPRPHSTPKSPAKHAPDPHRKPKEATVAVSADGAKPGARSPKGKPLGLDAAAIKKEPVHHKKRVVPPLPPRSLPKRGELGEEAKNSLFTNPPPRYEPAITLDSVKSGAIDVDAVLNNQPVAGHAPAQPQPQETAAVEGRGDSVTSEESALRLGKLIKGQGVYAKWDEDNVYYPARVEYAHVDGSYTVVFDDGVERTLPRGLIIAVVPKHYLRQKKSPVVKTENAADKPQTAEIEPPGNDSDTDSVIECICGTNADCGRMIQCDRCETWHHNECIGIGPHEVGPTRFSCHNCKRIVYARTPQEVFMSYKYPSLLRQLPSGPHKDAKRQGERLRYSQLLVNEQLHVLRRAMNASALKLAELADISKQANGGLSSSASLQHATSHAHQPGNEAGANTVAVPQPSNDAAANTAAVPQPGNDAAANIVAVPQPGNDAAANTVAVQQPGNDAAANTVAVEQPGNDASADHSVAQQPCNEAAGSPSLAQQPGVDPEGDPTSVMCATEPGAAAGSGEALGDGEMPVPCKRQLRLYLELDRDYNEVEKRLRLLESRVEELGQRGNSGAAAAQH